MRGWVQRWVRRCTAFAHVTATFEASEAEAPAELARATAELEALPMEVERTEAELVELAPELTARAHPRVGFNAFTSAAIPRARHL